MVEATTAFRFDWVFRKLKHAFFSLSQYLLLGKRHATSRCLNLRRAGERIGAMTALNCGVTRHATWDTAWKEVEEGCYDRPTPLWPVNTHGSVTTTNPTVGFFDWAKRNMLIQWICLLRRWLRFSGCPSQLFQLLDHAPISRYFIIHWKNKNIPP